MDNVIIMRKKLGIYAGSFNPFTIGHFDIYKKAVRILGKENVMIAIGWNPDKPKTDTLSRAEELALKIKCDVVAYVSFLHELILEKEAEGYDVVLIRGLRNGEDLAHEANQLRIIKDFLPKDYALDVMLLLSDEKYNHVSSSLVRGLEKFREGSGKSYVYNG